jgi:hypothetical protein
MGRAGPGGVLDECDRGESALLKAADRALRDDLPDELHDHVAVLRDDIDAAVKAIRSQRRRLDEDFAQGGHRGSLRIRLRDSRRGR